MKDSFGDGILNMGYFKVVVDGVRAGELGDALEFSERSIWIDGCPSSDRSPSPSPPCSEDEVEVAVELKADNYPAETSFEIRHAVGDAVVVPLTKPRLPRRIMRESYCLGKFVGDYLFHIHDAGGDGLKDLGEDWDLSGQFKVFVDGELARSGSDGTNFGFNDTVVIRTRS